MGPYSTLLMHFVIFKTCPYFIYHTWFILFTSDLDMICYALVSKFQQRVVEFNIHVLRYHIIKLTLEVTLRGGFIRETTF